MIEDVVSEYKFIISRNKFNSVEDIRNHKNKVIRFSKSMYEDNQKLRKFLLKNV